MRKIISLGTTIVLSLFMVVTIATAGSPGLGPKQDAYRNLEVGDKCTPQLYTAVASSPENYFKYVRSIGNNDEVFKMVDKKQLFKIEAQAGYGVPQASIKEIRMYKFPGERFAKIPELHMVKIRCYIGGKYIMAWQEIESCYELR